MIKENLCTVLNNIERACADAGRDKSEVKLIAVSKLKSVDDIKEAYDCGIRDFGENYVQELCEKAKELPGDINWHMIGHLQTNKVKYIAEFISMIHSVDSVKLAKTIDKEAKKHNRIIPILIEVNVGEEESKFGVAFENLESMLMEISELENIEIRGLMTSAPYTDNTDLLAEIFEKLRKLDLDMTSKNINNYKGYTLSMGMSNDYDIAIRCGSTMVRIGTDIFGRRE